MSQEFKLPGGETATRASDGGGRFRMELHTTSGPPVVLREEDIDRLWHLVFGPSAADDAEATK